jgi:DNA-binding MarR family transcriptional regulator
MQTTFVPNPANPADAADSHRLGAEAVLADFGRVLGSARCAGSQRLVRLGISMTHFHVLTLLRHHDAMQMGRLAEILDVSLSNATGVIDRMEERGLVERVRVPDDRRVVLVKPTQPGLDLVDEVELVKSDVMAQALARLDADQLDRLTVAVAELRAAIEGEMAENPDSYGVLGGCSHDGQPHAHNAHHAHHGHNAQPVTQTS